jgi:hypothetical protein
MSIRGIDLSTDFVMSLHKELWLFSEHYSVEIKTLTVFNFMVSVIMTISYPILKLYY